MGGHCKRCGKPFLGEQGKRFDTSTGGAYHDACWPFICCAECGFEPQYGAMHGITECYCMGA